MHQAVCAAFPEITTYGTFRGDGEHAQGIAVDIMVAAPAAGRSRSSCASNDAELGVSTLIYSQQIWSVDAPARAGGHGGPGSATANHYDHVHVTTY